MFYFNLNYIFFCNLLLFVFKKLFIFFVPYNKSQNLSSYYLVLEDIFSKLYVTKVWTQHIIVVRESATTLLGFPRPVPKLIRALINFITHNTFFLYLTLHSTLMYTQPSPQ